MLWLADDCILRYLDWQYIWLSLLLSFPVQTPITNYQHQDYEPNISVHEQVCVFFITCRPELMPLGVSGKYCSSNRQYFLLRPSSNCHIVIVLPIHLHGGPCNDTGENESRLVVVHLKRHPEVKEDSYWIWDCHLNISCTDRFIVWRKCLRKKMLSRRTDGWVAQ